MVETCEKNEYQHKKECHCAKEPIYVRPAEELSKGSVCPGPSKRISQYTVSSHKTNVCPGPRRSSSVKHNYGDQRDNAEQKSSISGKGETASAKHRDIYCLYFRVAEFVMTLLCWILGIVILCCGLQLLPKYFFFYVSFAYFCICGIDLVGYSMSKPIPCHYIWLMFATLASLLFFTTAGLAIIPVLSTWAEILIIILTTITGTIFLINVAYTLYMAQKNKKYLQSVTPLQSDEKIHSKKSSKPEDTSENRSKYKRKHKGSESDSEYIRQSGKRDYEREDRQRRQCCGRPGCPNTHLDRMSYHESKYSTGYQEEIHKGRYAEKGKQCYELPDRPCYQGREERYEPKKQCYEKPDRPCYKGKEERYEPKKEGYEQPDRPCYKGKEERYELKKPCYEQPDRPCYQRKVEQECKTETVKEKPCYEKPDRPCYQKKVEQDVKVEKPCYEQPDKPCYEGRQERREERVIQTENDENQYPETPCFEIPTKPCYKPPPEPECHKRCEGRTVKKPPPWHPCEKKVEKFEYASKECAAVQDKTMSIDSTCGPNTCAAENERYEVKSYKMSKQSCGAVKETPRKECCPCPENEEIELVNHRMSKQSACEPIREIPRKEKCPCPESTYN